MASFHHNLPTLHSGVHNCFIYPSIHPPSVTYPIIMSSSINGSDITSTATSTAKLIDKLSKKVAKQRDELNKKDAELNLQLERVEALIGRLQYFQQLPDNTMSGGSQRSAMDAYLRESARQLRRFLKMKLLRKSKPVFGDGWKMFAPNNPKSFFSRVFPLLVLPPDCDLRDYWFRFVVDEINKIMISYRSDTTTAIRKQFMRKNV